VSSSREHVVRRAGVIIGFVLGLYLIARAIAEPFVIDVTNPATYRHDWGGPSLLGVLAVHCGPGLLAAAVMARQLARRYSTAKYGAELPSAFRWPRGGQRTHRCGQPRWQPPWRIIGAMACRAGRHRRD
jgi:hypothetical protein